MRKVVAIACVLMALSACCSNGYHSRRYAVAAGPMPIVEMPAAAPEVEYGKLVDLKAVPCAYDDRAMAVTVTGRNSGYDARNANYRIDWYDAAGVMVSRGDWNSVAVPAKADFKWVSVAKSPYAAGYKVYVKQAAPTMAVRDPSMNQIDVRDDFYGDRRCGCLRQASRVRRGCCAGRRG